MKVLGNKSDTHKVSIYKEYHSVCSLVGIGTLPTPLSPAANVPLPPEPGGRGHTHLRVRGWGSPNSDDWRKSLALCLLCADNTVFLCRGFVIHRYLEAPLLYKFGGKFYFPDRWRFLPFSWTKPTSCSDFPHFSMLQRKWPGHQVLPRAVMKGPLNI